MGFGAHGPCGQRVRPVAVRGLGRGSDRAIVPLLNLAASLAVAPRDKWETAATGRVQVKNMSVLELVLFLLIHPTDPENSSNWLQSIREWDFFKLKMKCMRHFIFPRLPSATDIDFPALYTGPVHPFNFS